jgi:hypothetical protein
LLAWLDAGPGPFVTGHVQCVETVWEEDMHVSGVSSVEFVRLQGHGWEFVSLSQVMV